MFVVAIIILACALCYYGLKIFKEFQKLKNLKIANLSERFPLFIIEYFYPIVKIGLMSAEKRFEIIAEYCFKYPNMIKAWFGIRVLIFVSDPDHVQKILMSQKCIEKWNLFYVLIGIDSGLVSASTKKKWKEHRKFFNFSFSAKVLESFTNIFIEHSRLFCDKLEEKAENGKEFDFLPYAKRSSFDILCATCLGLDTNELKNDEIQEIFEANEM